MDNVYPPRFRNGGTFYMPGPHDGGPSSLQWVIFGLQLLILAALTVLLVRAFAGPRFRRRGGPPANEVLRHRYARGEISREEYLQAAEDLGTPTAEL